MSLQWKLQQAVALHQRGQLVQAQSLYEQILSEQPRHFDALHLLGVVAAHRGEPQKALELIDQALEIDASQAATHFNRGTTLQGMKQRHAAMASYDRAVAIQPDFAEAYVNRGVVQTELGLWDAALASCNRALTIRGEYAEAYYNRGNVFKELARWAAALADYDHAIAIRSNYAEAFFNRANVRRSLGQRDAALADFGRAIGYDPGQRAVPIVGRCARTGGDSLLAGTRAGRSNRRGN